MLALLYDVHGNLPALEAVLDDARRQGADRFVIGGDVALFGGWPAETLATLRGLDAGWLRGNAERWTAAPDEAPENEVVQGAIAAAQEALGDDDVRELAGLPGMLLAGGDRFCHGSPISDVRSFLPTPADDEPELLADVEEQRLVFGHTHLPFRRISTTGGIELVNPGSVGLPFDRDPRAAFALVHHDRSVEHRRVPYDHETSARTVRERFPGWGETVARRIEQARMDVEEPAS